MPDVVVVGAGPVGLLLSAELARRGVDVVVVERRPAGRGGSRAIGIHAPVLAALEQGGTTDRLLTDAVRVTRGECRADGRRPGTAVLGSVHFDALSTRFPFVATLPQAATEAALGHAAPAVRRGVTVTAVTPLAGGDRVCVRATGPGGEEEWDAAAVVIASGAGGRDLVYRPGAVATRHYPDRYVMADAPVAPRADPDVAVVTLGRGGVLESFPLPGGRRRFVAWDGRDDRPSKASAAPDDALDERLRAAMAERGEADAAASVSGATAFRIRRAVAPRLRRGRVFVVGDAAHEVSPIGGQGMNLGLLDAAGLAPLLAEWVRTGDAPDAALERWERRRVQSARIAAGIASANTMLGRPRTAAGHTMRSAALRALLTAPSGMLFAHAYAMGFDRGA